MNFWQKLPKPFFVLAPMADVTDAPFRRMIAKYSAHKRSDGTIGGPDVMWTEFVSADGLMLAPEEGRKKLMADLMYSEEERPIVAQLFSSNEEYMEAAAKLCRELGFDGLDINMGCPDRSIEKQGCGAAMIKNPQTARAIIRAAKRGAKDLPVSVKTRVGYNKDEIEDWIPELLAEEPAALTVHARTRREMSKVPADWSRLKKVIELRDKLAPKVLVIGNGDVLSLEDAEQKVEQYGVDGVMLGRAIFGNPYLFHPSKRLPERIALSASSSTSHRNIKYGSDVDSSLPRSVSEEAALDDFDFPPSSSQPDTSLDLGVVTLEERLEIMVEHTKLFEELLPFKNFAIMKKHYKAYVNSFDGASLLREDLMNTKSAEEVEKVVHDFLKKTGAK